MRTNFTIFLFFFGIALLDSIQGGQWWRVLFWVAIGAVFFWADRKRVAAKTS